MSTISQSATKYWVQSSQATKKNKTKSQTPWNIATDLVTKAVKTIITGAALGIANLATKKLIISPWKLEALGVRLTKRALNFPIKGLVPQETADTLHNLLVVPIVNSGTIISGLFPINIYDINISEVFIRASIEEIVFRGAIQQVALPTVASLLPTKCEKLLNHQVSRIALTSLLFALSHVHYWDTPTGIPSTFIGGLIYGFAAEAENGGLPLVMIAHTIHNLAVKLLKN